MKRKIDKTEGAPPKEVPASTADDEFSFTDLGLDPRLVQAVAELKFLKPTLVQRKAIPHALKGQDVLCKAKTGSGKTAAYVLPVLASILKRKMVRTDAAAEFANVAPRPNANNVAERHRARYISTDSCTDTRTGRPGV